MKSLLGLTSKVSRFSRYSINGLLKTTPPAILGISLFTASQTVTQTPNVIQTDAENRFHSMVSEYYGKTLQSSSDLKTSACCTAAAPPDIIKNALKNVPDEVSSKYYGCGSPLPFGVNDLTVLDLGSGSGRDCYVASQLVGENGNVIGIDMTDEQLEVSRKYINDFCLNKLGYKKPNIKFIKGYIEMLPKYLDKESVDIVISNCVVNLSPRKDKVLSGVFEVLKEGGEFYFSDVYCDRRLPENIRNHEVLVGECLGGALYIEDFRRICQDVGFKDPRILSYDEIKVQDKGLKKILGNAKFYSITYRLFKYSEIEDKCEDFGQVAIYDGTIDGHSDYYDLDDHHRFITNKPMLVCGNTADMVGNTWLSPHFKVTGNKDVHYGLFDCSPLGSGATASSDIGGACC